MKPVRLPLFLVFATLALSGCNDKFATEGYGDTEGYGTEKVGLCSYLGGCMPESGDSQ